MSDDLRAAYLSGYIDGLRAFAWWKDGTQYVGSCGTTLAQAEAEANRKWGPRLERVKRTGHVSEEEAAHYNAIRERVEEEIPPGHLRILRKRKLSSLAYSRAGENP